MNVNGQKKWTFRECMEYAEQHNIDLKKRLVDIEDAENNLQMMKNSRLPDLSLGAGQSISFGRTQSERSGVYEQMTGTNTSYSLSSGMNLYSGGKINSNIKARSFDLKAAAESMKSARENIELQIVSYYLDALFKKEILRINRDQAELNKKQVERTQTLVDAGSVPLSQLYDIKSQYAKDVMNITTAENEVQLSLLNLALLLNYLGEGTFDIVDPELSPNLEKVSPDSPDAIYDISVKERPAIKGLEYRIQSTQYMLDAARADFYPTITFGVGYNNGFNYILESKYKSLNDPVWDQLNANRTQRISININVPIFNRFQTRGRVTSAQNSLKNANLQLDQAKMDLYKEIRQAHQRVVASNAKLDAAAVSLEAAEQAFNFADNSYKAGKSTVFEYNDAQSRLFRSRSEHIQARYELIFQNKILNFYKGIPIQL